MRKKTMAVDAIWAIGQLIVVLGLVNCVAAPMLFRTPLSLLMPEDGRVMLYMIIATGVATSFAGLLIVFASQAMRRYERWAWRLAWRIVLFLLLLGGGAVYVMLNNPFAHVLLAFVLALIIALPMSRAILRTDPRMEWPK
jgi:hypothetical protein